MNHYELLFILPGTLTEEEVAPLVEKVKSIVVDSGAEDISISDMGKNRLAYPIRHIRYGYFQICRFQSEKDQVAGIQKKLGLIPELLRALVQVYDPEKQKQVKIDRITTAEKARAPRETTSRPQTQQKTEEVPLDTAPVAKKPKEKVEEKQKKRVSLEEIDEQLDKIILDTDISDV